MDLVLATKNPDKVIELRVLVARFAPEASIVTGQDWPDVAETGETLEENALLKAQSVADATGHAALGDDTGLEVAALHGAPGVRSARFSGPDATYASNRAALLDALDGVADRSARFRTVCCLVMGDRIVFGEGTIAGQIAREERGTGGFGYDPLFEVGGRTLSEMGEGEKNLLSHRARAVEAVFENLAG
jgi:XTP/dITP diphosphohydrolase